jgi:hypothetical protein
MLAPLKLRDFRLAFPAQPACQGQNPYPPEQRERNSRGFRHGRLHIRSEATQRDEAVGFQQPVGRR